MRRSLLLALVPWLAAPAVDPEGWDELAAEYDLAYEAWVTEMQRSGGFTKPEAERVPGPAAAFWERFEALADGGDGRAVLWMLANPWGAGEERAQRRRAAFARVKAGGSAEWVAQALHRLGAEHAGIEAGELVAYLEAQRGPDRPAELRAAAALARAAVLEPSQSELADRLRIWAALLRHERVDAALEPDLAPEDVAELGRAVTDELDRESQAYFRLAYRQGAGGGYFPKAGAPPRPEEVWQPVLETLADAGSTEARLWVVFNVFPADEAETERLRGHFDALMSAAIPDEGLSELGWRLDNFITLFGADFVEPRIRALLASVAEPQRAGLLLGLGNGLCAAASDDAQRQRGLALLREVQTRWPDSPQAGEAARKIFRHENLVVGKRVPDFEATDVDGNAFKLSDYLGKVTVLDFWGFW